jgi:hypothetical protein
LAGSSGRTSGTSSCATVCTPSAQKYTVSSRLIHTADRYLNAKNRPASAAAAMKGNCSASLCSSFSATSCASDSVQPRCTVSGAASSICTVMGTGTNSVAACSAASSAYDVYSSSPMVDGWWDGARQRREHVADAC